MPADVPTGWECPRCRRVYSPQTGQCLPCSPPTLLPAILPRPEPRRFPHPIGGLPADVPEPRPCPPSREGGMCGCVEDGEEAGPLVPLSPLMARPGYAQVSKIDREWREVFAGLQARTTEETTVEFRLTPQEDGRP